MIAVGAETFGHSSPHPIAVDVSTGREHDIGTRSWHSVEQLAWLPDGKSFLMVAHDFSSPMRGQIWRVSYPNGVVSRITNDLNNYFGSSITVNGAALATVKSQALSNIWVAAKGDWDHPRQITHGFSNVDGTGGLSWTADGSIVYTSVTSGTQSLWTVNPENGQDRKLALMQSSVGGVGKPSACGASPGYITLAASTREGSNIWRSNPDGSGLKQLTDGPTDGSPSCSADGKWVVYHSGASGKAEVWRVSIDGGKPVQLTSVVAAWTPSISPNSKWIVFQVWGNHPNELGVVPFAGGQLVKTFGIPPTTQLSRVGITPAWTPDSRAIDYVVQNAGVSNIFRQPIAGGAPVQVTHYDSDHIFWFAISRDGQLALARGSQSSDVVLIRNLQ